MEGNREPGSKNVNQINEELRAWRGIMQFVEGGVRLALTNDDGFAERIMNSRVFSVIDTGTEEESMHLKENLTWTECVIYRHGERNCEIHRRMN